jgi:hypothetical protein
LGEDCELLEERAAALRKAGRVAGDETAWLALAP